MESQDACQNATPESAFDDWVNSLNPRSQLRAYAIKNREAYLRPGAVEQRRLASERTWQWMQERARLNGVVLIPHPYMPWKFTAYRIREPLPGMNLYDLTETQSFATNAVPGNSKNEATIPGVNAMIYLAEAEERVREGPLAGSDHSKAGQSSMYGGSSAVSMLEPASTPLTQQALGAFNELQAANKDVGFTEYTGDKAADGKWETLKVEPNLNGASTRQAIVLVVPKDIPGCPGYLTTPPTNPSTSCSASMPSIPPNSSGAELAEDVVECIDGDKKVNEHPASLTTEDQGAKPTESTGPIVSAANPEFQEIANELEQMQLNTDVRIPNNLPGFRPSRHVQESQGLVPVPDPIGETNYRGDPTSRSFTQQVQDLPDEENCSLWITGLPPNVIEARVLESIHTGAVYALHINHAGNSFYSSAAKLVFMTHEGAANFLAQIQSEAGVMIGNRRMKAIYNRHGYRDFEHREHSRVLRIHGPEKFMTRKFWVAYFNKCAKYQIGHFRMSKSKKNGYVIVECGFARFDGQAEFCYKAINAEPRFRGIIKVRYAADPCDPNPSIA